MNKGGLDMSNVVFSVHMPHPGDEFDPYEQFIVVSMNVEIEKKFASVSQLERTRTAGQQNISIFQFQTIHRKLCDYFKLI